MKKRDSQIFSCDACGYRSPKWLGRCPSCTTWDSMSGHAEYPKPSHGRLKSIAASAQAEPYDQLTLESSRRIPSGITEFDRALGGGFVPGMVVLLGGEPGVGKSTLALQCASVLGSEDGPALYVTAEESKAQLRLRGERLSLKPDGLLVLAENNLLAIEEEIERLSPAFAIVDSIQAVASPELPASAGSIVQVRECALRLLTLAKARGLPMLLVGHITKEGSLAGPKHLEHMVDTVLTFEGDSDHAHRMLRCTKNRFGPIDEVGIFTMAQAGLECLVNPSQWFLRDRQAGSPGSAVTVHREGSRTFLVEVQALAGRPAHGSPQRTAVGIDSTRLSLIAAVLERHIGLPLTSLDLFANAAGGVRLQDPGADLALAAALASAVTQQSLDPDTVFLGEIGLAGEVRSVPRVGERVRETARCGFSCVVLPERDSESAREAGLEVIAVRSVAQALETLFDLRSLSDLPAAGQAPVIQPRATRRFNLKGGPITHA
ncbi:MAG: DNA repair protein RadA [Acidobacteria bacterium]|nr:DNA repair protein RadA [Acidobacteriota bacterium]